MDDFESKYGNQYDDLRLYPEQSVVVSVILGVIGAVVGAVPGFLLWLLLARLNFISVACAAVIALGSTFGYRLMTKKNEPPAIVGIITCVAVLVILVYLATRIDWAWEIAKVFNEKVYPEYVDSLQAFDLWTEAEIKDSYQEVMTEEFGFSEVTFGNCFSNLGVLLEYFDLKFKFGIALAEAALCAFAGGFAAFKYFGK